MLATLIPSVNSSRVEIRELARDRRVVLAGAGITDGIAADVGAEHFGDGPLEAATYLAIGSWRYERLRRRSAGASGTTPIMESRVTRPASASSSSDSVLAGRRGTTRVPNLCG